MADRWLIVGSTAAGKTTAGRLFADRLRLSFADLDEALEAALARPLASAYDALGEEAVRLVEQAVAIRLLAETDGVLAFGGGTFAMEAVRAAAREGGWQTAYLRAHPEEAARRVMSDGRTRPGCDGEGATAALLARRFVARDAIYGTARFRVQTDGLTPEQVADALVGQVQVHPLLWVEDDASGLAALLSDRIPTGRLLLLTDPVLTMATEALRAALIALGREVRCIEVAGGEPSKRPEQLIEVWQAIFAGPVDRGDTVVTVGGGVVSDLGGFSAATAMRGLPVVHVTTTLMGMVDAAIGGKTGVDLPSGKNLVGAFHQPRFVVQWAPMLQTLPPREFVSGLAEVVKCALLSGEAALVRLEADAEALLAREPQAVARAVAMASAVKLAIAGRDPTERGERMLLNLGHTFGHALEAATEYQQFLHGEAVAIGLVTALNFGVDLGSTDPALPARVAALLDRLGLPVELPLIAPDFWKEALARDKKRSGSAVRFVICRAPGACETSVVELHRVDAWIRRSFSGKLENG